MFDHIIDVEKKKNDCSIAYGEKKGGGGRLGV